jgi:Flp pilus assembly protein TadD
MFERVLLALRNKGRAGWGAAVLLAALSAVYLNHFHNGFHFDDAHTIENNAAIRELRNIPLFFRDATTFSSLPSNQSYRPLVSTLLALAYHLGGLDPFWFHVSIFALFAALTLLLAFVVYSLLEKTASAAANVWISLAAAACYGLHPANADTVNYSIASAEIMASLGIVASFAIYFAFPQLRRYYVYVLPAALAILGKPPAAIFAFLFAIFRLLFPDETSRRDRAIEIAPSFVLCAAMLLFVQRMTPSTWSSGAASAHNYLLTQPYVALLYFKTFFWPFGLSADYDLNPFTTTADPRFWLGFGFIAVIVTISVFAACFKRTRLIGFGLLWFLIALLPTSLFPLAEVMNDHRAFLPYIGLVIAIGSAAAQLFAWLDRLESWKKTAAACAAVMFLCANGYATVQRNKVWKNEQTLWRDVVLESPRNPRGLMNYGNTLMAKGDFTEALDYFRRAQSIAPRYPVLFINLAIAEGAMKQDAVAEQHFKEALRLAPSSPDSYTYYARFLIDRSRADEARTELERAMELSPTDLFAHDLFTRIDSQTPESLLALSLQRYREGRYAESIAACRRALELRPNYAEAWNNIGAANNKLGRYEEAAGACEQALRYKPDFELARNNLQYARDMAHASSKSQDRIPP